VGEIDLALAQRHWALYQSGLKYGKYWTVETGVADGLLGENLGKDDVQHADPAAYMTVHALLAYSDPCMLSSRNRRYIPDAIAVDKETRLLQVAACLEMVAATAPASAYARFLLIRVYRYLGRLPWLSARNLLFYQVLFHWQSLTSTL
jgi:hypothetical protein